MAIIFLLQVMEKFTKIFACELCGGKLFLWKLCGALSAVK
jgi:hypothetical protein